MRSLNVNVTLTVAEFTVTEQQKQSSGACGAWGARSVEPVVDEMALSASQSWGASRSSAVHARSTQTKKRATAWCRNRVTPVSIAQANDRR